MAVVRFLPDAPFRTPDPLPGCATKGLRVSQMVEREANKQINKKKNTYKHHQTTIAFRECFGLEYRIKASESRPCRFQHFHSQTPQTQSSKSFEPDRLCMHIYPVQCDRKNQTRNRNFFCGAGWVAVFHVLLLSRSLSFSVAVLGFIQGLNQKGNLPFFVVAICFAFTFAYRFAPVVGLLILILGSLARSRHDALTRMSGFFCCCYCRYTPHEAATLSPLSRSAHRLRAPRNVVVW